MVLNIPIDMRITSNRGYLEVLWSEVELSEFLRFDLVRKKSSVPAHYFDGKKVYSGDDLSYKDYDVKNGVVYYYRLFIVINEGENYNTDYLSNVRCIVKSMAFTSDARNYGEQLYKTLPDQVLADDARSDQNTPLLRYFRLIFHEFDKLDVISGSILDQLDIENCDEAFLPYHARWLGLEYDRNFDVTTNRLLLSSWKEVQPYQGTETGVKYLLRKVFKSDVTIHVDTVVNINVITLYVDDTRYWMINHVDKVNKMIKRFLALRTKYDLVIKLGALDDDYDKSRLEDEHVLDYITFSIDIENYNKVGQISNENFLISSTLFFSDLDVDNRVVDEFLDIVKSLDVEQYELSAPSALGNEDYLLSDNLYFSKMSRDSDVLVDFITTSLSEAYDKLKRNEYSFDAVTETISERYDGTPLLSNPEFVLSGDEIFFADGTLKIVDWLSDFGTVKDDESYTLGFPALLNDEHNLISSTLTFSVALNENVDRLLDTVEFIAIDEQYLSYKASDESSDAILDLSYDGYDRSRMATENLDVVISNEQEAYSLKAPSMLSFENSLISTNFLFNIEHTKDTDILKDMPILLDSESYSGVKADLDSSVLWDSADDSVYREATFNSSSFLISATFLFGVIDAYVDELEDSVVYTRPVGLFAMADALLSESMFTCDNIL